MIHLSREGVRREWGGQEIMELIPSEPAGNENGMKGMQGEFSLKVLI